MTEYKPVQSIDQASKELEEALECNELICITGPPAVGKTTMTRRVLDKNHDQFMYCYIDCYEVATPTQLYTTICSRLHGNLNITKKHDVGKYITSFQTEKQTVLGQDFPVYCREFHQAADKRNYVKLFIVLDHIDSFRGTTMVEAIALLLKIKYINIIWITTKSPTDIIMYISNVSPSVSLVAQNKSLPIYLSCWSRPELIDVILNSPPKRGADLYKTFVNNVVNLAYSNNTKSVKDIKLFCQENFEQFLNYYQEKVREKIRKDFGTNGDTDDSDEIEIPKSYTTGLIKSFLQSLRGSIRHFGLSNLGGDEEQEQRLKMPVNTATLMVAAFIASKTKTSDDRKNFVKCQKKSARAQSSARGNCDKMSKQFTMERLIHIYLSLHRMSDGKVGQDLHITQNNDNVLSDIERLESLNILKICSGDGISSDTRYKLSSYIRREYIDKMAAHANIELEHLHGL